MCEVEFDMEALHACLAQHKLVLLKKSLPPASLYDRGDASMLSVFGPTNKQTVNGSPQSVSRMLLRAVPIPAHAYCADSCLPECSHTDRSQQPEPWQLQLQADEVVSSAVWPAGLHGPTPCCVQLA